MQILSRPALFPFSPDSGLLTFCYKMNLKFFIYLFKRLFTIESAAACSGSHLHVINDLSHVLSLARRSSKVEFFRFWNFYFPMKNRLWVISCEQERQEASSYETSSEFRHINFSIWKNTQKVLLESCRSSTHLAPTLASESAAGN